MAKTLSVFIIIFLMISQAQAQNTRYIIKLRDKGSNPFSLSNPSQYLTARSIARRTRYNIALDSTDLPVTPRYIDSIRLAGNVQIINVSKWLNHVAIKTSDVVALAKINSFAFVVSSQPIAAKNPEGFVAKQKFETEAALENETVARAYNYGLSNGQVKLHRTDWLHNRGFRGETMQLAMLDGGFFRFNTLPTFDSARNNGQVLGTYDFVANETSVGEDDAHGMQCLSTIVANLPGSFVGMAPKVSFYLYRTEEVATEYPIEEQNFVAGLEKADSLGVDVTSTSLGYTTFDNPAFDHTYAEMNGNTTISARGADFAAKKGILNVIAAGNEGTSPWRYLATPSDADSVLAVGAVDTLGNVAAFSSYGPSSDGQVKPGVAAVGLRSVIANPSTGQPQYGNGTSFACPNMAGVVICLWQAFPEVNNMSIINALQKSATKANNPDDRVGYGIPDVVKAFILLEKQLFTQTVTPGNCTVKLAVRAKTTDDITIYLERKTTGQNQYSRVDSVKGSGAFALRDYVFTNSLAGLAAGTVQYRTAMTIGNEPLFYLDSSNVTTTQSCLLGNGVTIGPNPVTSTLNVTVQRTEATNITIDILNAAGQKMTTTKKMQAVGSSLYSFFMGSYAKGIYFVNVYAGNKKINTTKILR